jgi:catechol 2,3-dioxygenase-like lactoylglutathione lyase family enzyme
MIQSTMGHIVVNVNPENFAFYRDLFGFLGWAKWADDPSTLGFGDKHGASVWFGAPIKPVSNDYDGTGMNHLALGVPNQADVDLVVTYLQEHGVPALFETPRHRPDFCSDPATTYYQVMFESPDRILLEVVYLGLKAN